MPDYSNYAESSVAGTSYKRACRIFIENPLGGAPTLTIVEEEAIVLADKTITNVVANLTVAFDPANQQHMAAYAVLNDIYVDARTKRDAAAITPPEGTPVI